MRRRVIAGLSAVLLAGLGAVLLLSYVGGADERAMAGLDTVRVLVVTKRIPQGTPAETVSGDVRAKVLPVVAVVPGTVADVGELTGKVATTDLEPGEQLLASRFAVPKAPTGVEELKIPAGLQEISIALDAQRVLGGHLVAGARVGLFVSLPKDGTDPAMTRLLLQKVLVSRVEGGVAPPPAGGPTPSPSSSTGSLGSAGSSGSSGSSGLAGGSGRVTVTLALSATDAEKVVFGAENGTIWLSLQAASTSPGSRGVTAQELTQ